MLTSSTSASQYYSPRVQQGSVAFLWTKLESNIQPSVLQNSKVLIYYVYINSKDLMLCVNYQILNKPMWWIDGRVRGNSSEEWGTVGTETVILNAGLAHPPTSPYHSSSPLETSQCAKLQRKTPGDTQRQHRSTCPRRRKCWRKR